MSEVLKYACGVLARREYAVEELRARLQSRWPEDATIDQVIDQLVDEGLLSDRRFAESFVRSRVGKFQGPRKIRAVLLQRGVPDSEIERALAREDSSWTQLAVDWLLRQRADVRDYQTRAAFYRRLSNRGFTHSQAMSALDRSQDPGSSPGNR